MASAADVRIRADALDAAVASILAALGIGARERAIVAGHLVEANLRGHDSHGVGMLPAYVANVLSGEMRRDGALRAVSDAGATLVFDAELGIGQVAAHDALEAAIARAARDGTCVLALRHAHHIGRIGAWAEQCAAAGLVSIHFVNVVSTPSVAPFNGRAPRVGTNPMAIGIPRRGADPVIVDFATSRLAVGKIRVARNKGETLPEGVLLDSGGEPTRSPGALFATPPGAILPFGEHKGWALAFACEALGAALTGGTVQKGPKRRNAIVNCMLSILISPERLGTGESYFRELEDFVAWAQKPPEGHLPGVLLPGDPERIRRAERLRDGIPVDAATWDQIRAAAVSAGIDAAAFDSTSGLA